jgi:hypothetical protein
VGATAEDEVCHWPLLEIVAGPDNVARSTHWIQACSSVGQREYWATATYGPSIVVQPATKPQMTAAKAGVD